MKICVFGGSGLVGSSIAKKAVKRGWNVVSVSQSGKPFRTPAGHSPAWVDQVSSSSLSLSMIILLSWQETIRTGRMDQGNPIRSHYLCQSFTFLRCTRFDSRNPPRRRLQTIGSSATSESTEKRDG